MLKASDAVESGNINIPRTRYQCQVCTSTFGPSKRGIPMITLGCQVYGRDGETTITYNGRDINIAGLKFTVYMSLSPKAIHRLWKFHRKLGLPLEIDENNPDLKIYEDLCFDAILYSTENYAMEEQSEDEIGEDPKPILTKDNKKIPIGYKINVLAVAGPASEPPTDPNL